MVKPKEPLFKHGWGQPYVVFALYGLFAGLGGLLTLATILETGSESTNVSLLGFSVQRILLGLGIILVALVFLSGAVSAIKNHQWAEKLWDIGIRQKPVSDILFWVAATSLLVGWIGYFLPAYRLPENLSEYFIRLKPIMLWFISISAATLTLFLTERNHGYGRKIIIANKTAIIAGAIILLIFLLISAFITFSGFGLRIREDYWYGAGVPVFGLQIIFTIAIGAYVNWIEHKAEYRFFRRFDLILCLALWVVTAFLWAREPLRHSFFMPGPYAPNSEFYPYSDGATFDIASQFALIGQGLFNGQFFDRVLYPAFLTVLHFIVGQNSEQLMRAQAIIFAVFPVLIYLLVKEIHSRALGISVGVLVMLRGITSITAATWIDLAGPKTMLTDFPTAIGIVGVALLVTKWFREPARIHLMLWVGAALGLTVMLRTHALLLLPVIAAYMIVKVPHQKKLWLVVTALLILGMLAVTIPWDYRNHTKGFPLFFTYFARIYTVLQQRYGIPAGTFLPPRNIYALSATDNPPIHHLGSAHPDFLIYPQIIQIRRCETRSCLLVNHFFHNLTTSVLFLPDSFVLDDLWRTVKESSPYWQQNWRGEGFGFPEGIFVTANLSLVALGLGLAWQRSKFAGLLPAVLFFTYILSNAIAQTSGGRYIVPVDWVVCLYFMLGVLQLTIWALSLLGIGSYEVQQAEKEFEVYNVFPQLHFGRILGSLVFIFAIGALIPLLEIPFPRHYQTTLPEETLTMLDQQGWLKKANLNKEEITNFLSNPQAEIILGRALYPRYYKMEDGEPGRDYPYIVLAFPRLVFIAIGPFGTQSVILPGSMPDFIPQAGDVVVIGCREENYLDALVMFVLKKPDGVYLRSPHSVLQCPLQEIYCENNVTCFPK